MYGKDPRFNVMLSYYGISITCSYICLLLFWDLLCYMYMMYILGWKSDSINMNGTAYNCQNVKGKIQEYEHKYKA